MLSIIFLGVYLAENKPRIVPAQMHENMFAHILPPRAGPALAIPGSGKTPSAILVSSSR
jgi:hypothetical protein